MKLKTLFWALLALLVPSLIGLAAIDTGLKVPAAPLGIISFEFCGFSSLCDAALNEWGAKGQQLAMLSLGLDYLFMALYPSLICVGLLLVVPKLSGRLKILTTGLAWLALGAGLADAGENYCLIQIVLDGTGGFHGKLAGICASIKFLILGLTLGWLIVTSAIYALPRRRG